MGLAQTFVESTQVVVVEVPVQVIRNGEPVRGLTAEDFEVWDGREKQTLTGFEAVDLAELSGEALDICGSCRSRRAATS